MNRNHESNLAPEQCLHNKCDDPRRLNYCTIEAANEQGQLGQVIDQLNHVLYDVDTFDQANSTYTGDNDHKQLTRIYEQDYLPSELTSVVGYRLQTTIIHTQLKKPQREVYQVTAEWCIPDEDEISDKFRTEYYIERFDHSPTMATITEFELDPVNADLPVESMPPNRFADRPMTNYDHGQLLKLLADIKSLQAAGQSIVEH